MQPTGTSEIEILSLKPADVSRLVDDLVDVYRQAFRGPPYSKGENIVRQFQSTLPRHTERDGFRCVAAARAGRREFLGFGYGYTSRSGQWWHDQVMRKLDTETAGKWLGNAFEIVELAVRPALQGRGIGGCLHDALLEGLEQRTAVLSTLDADTRGFRLYRSRGWVVLRSGFYFSGVTAPYLIMGLRLASFSHS